MAPPHALKLSQSWPFDVSTAGKVPGWLRYLMAHVTYAQSSSSSHEPRAPLSPAPSAGASLASKSALSSEEETFKTCVSSLDDDEKLHGVSEDAVAWAPTLGCSLLALFLTVTLALAAVATTHVHYRVGTASPPIAADFEEVGELLGAAAFQPKHTSKRYKDVPVAAMTTLAPSSLRRATKMMLRTPSKSLQHAPEIRNATSGSLTTLFSAVTTAKKQRNKHKTQHTCAEVFYTHCLRTPVEFHYDLSSQECVATDGREEQLCARGVNRFTSEASCTRSCVRTRHPEQRRDVKGPQWNFDGRECRRWHFPRGRCPPAVSPGQDMRQIALLYTLYEECFETCVQPGQHRPDTVNKSSRVSTICHEALSARTCTEDQLRYPYFAAAGRREGGRGRLWCLPVASAFPLPGHRCLLGSNRFETRTLCQGACADSEV
ncbi:hypothetical protein HPB51_003996 [Rhipicephalus microplus]|uniref:BPTI/Kunitz inhibitor domain-containing protein n=1 Tax=Rhipicephalus microplus TaxID=6941 RepID=A0A9J6DTH4_RHIMP|nr:hypothetical protein HPB51_003996 [Rhipicephalus microplus]